MRILLFLSILFLLLCSVQASPTITAISTYVQYLNTATYGSVLGGTRLYFTGSEFPRDTSQFSIYIGPYPCAMRDGFTTRFSCMTSPVNVSGTFDIKVYISNTLIECNIAIPCQFTYKWEQTPQLWNLFPSATTPGNETKFFGIQKVNSATLTSLMIGSFICDFLENSAGDNKIIDFWYNYLKCRVSPMMPAGLYNASMDVLNNFGDAQNYPTLKKLSQNDTIYNIAIMPEINYLENHNGSIKGQIIRLQGKGFGSDPNKIQVFLDHRLPCKIISVDNENIACQLMEDTLNISQQIKNSSLFIGGSGVDYRKFKLNGENVVQMKAMKGFPNNYLSRNLMWELETPPNVDDLYGQTFFGYFCAPVSGLYKFYLSADSTAELWISKQANSTASLEKIAYLDYATGWRNYYQASTQISTEINLEKGQFYALETYHAANWGNDHITVAVEVPSNEWKLNSMVQQQIFWVICSMNDEQISMKIYNIKGGTFRFLMQTVNNEGLVNYSKTSRELPWNADEALITNCFNEDFEFYNATVQRYCLYYQGARKPDFSMGCEGHEWVITFHYYRKISPLPLINTDNLVRYAFGSITQEVKRLVNPSNPIRGTFMIVFKRNLTRELSYDAAPSIVREELKLLPGVSPFIEVTRTGNPDNGCTWTITYIDMIGETTMFNAISYLTGGKTMVTIGNVIKRSASMNQFFEGVPYFMLHTRHKFPQIVVKIDGLYAGCKENICDYTFLEESTLPFIDSFSINSSGMDIYLNNTEKNASLLSDYNVTFAGSICEIKKFLFDVAKKTTLIQCTIAKNADGSLILVAGYHVPSVFYHGVGFLPGKNKGNEAIFINMTFDSINPSQGSLSGGQKIVLLGHGFPVFYQQFTETNDNSLRIYFGNVADNKTCAIQSVNNTEISCTTPSYPFEQQVNITIVLNMNNFSLSAKYQYTMSKTPQIYSFSPQSSSPVLKTLLNIKGTGFSSPVNVYLTALNNTNDEIYECSIVSMNESAIQCVLPGGSSGKYRLKVVISGKGACDYQEKTRTNYDIYEYKILVSSIFPSFGSVFGGTLLTIQGENFARGVSQNQITLRSVGTNNIICDIASFNETSLQCITRPAPEQQETNTTVIVLSRLIECAQCTAKENACLFNYSRKATPLLTNAANLSKTSFFPGEFATLQGNLLINSTKAFLNSTEIQVISPNDGTLMLKIPDNSSFGAYFLMLRSDFYGFVDTQGARIRVKAQILGIDSRKFYSCGGLLSIQGQSFRNTGDLSVELAPGLSGDVIICKIIQEISPVKIQCLTGNLKEGANYKVNLRMMDQYYSCPLCSFDVKAINSTETPVITSVSPTEINEETGEILTIKANYLSNCQHFETILVGYNQEKAYYFSEFFFKRPSQDELALNFSQLGLVNGNYSLKINCQSLQTSCFLLSRNSQSFPLISVNFPAKIYPLQQVSSFEGGNSLYFQRKGQNISSKCIRICGIPCTPAIFNESHFIIKTPQLLTEKTVKNFAIKEKFQIIDEKIDWFADTPKNLLRNNSTFPGYSYISADSNQCFVGFSAAENMKIKLKSIKLYIPLENNEKFQGTRLESSQDNTSFAIVKEFDAYLLEGWYTLTIEEAVQVARFWRVKQENQKSAPYSRCFFQGFQVFAAFVLADEINKEEEYTCKVEVFNDSSRKYSVLSQNSVVYSSKFSGFVVEIAPKYASHAGGDILSIKTSELSSFLLQDSSLQVIIDEIPCEIKSRNSSYLTCKLGENLEFKSVGLQIKSEKYGEFSQGNAEFFYADRWSDAIAWGGESPPRSGDSVYIPKNQTILLDVSPPKLYAVIIEGTLLVEDTQDIRLQSQYIIIRGGALKAGSSSGPFEHFFEISLFGQPSDIQLPIFGSKVLGVFDGLLQLVGKTRQILRTSLKTPAFVGDSRVFVKDAVDWKSGMRVLLSNNEKSHEVLVIKAVNTTEKSIEFTTSLRFPHKIEVISGQDVASLVVLLSRNIVINSGDENSEQINFGGHISLYSSETNNLQAILYNIEAFNLGKIQSSGYSAISIHASNEAKGISLINMSIHESFSRGISLIGGRKIQILGNLLYKSFGHAICLQTGVEMQNFIENNLIILNRMSWNFFLSDLTPAGLYVTNLYNVIQGNKIIDCDYYGIWISLQNYTESPFFLMKICPNGIPLLTFQRNSAFSCKIGLFLYPEYIPRAFPCLAAKNLMKMQNPYEENPSKQVVFKEFVGFRNSLQGVFIYKLGAVVLDSFILIENVACGLEIRLLDACSDGLFSLNNSIFVGDAAGNQESYGLLCPKTPGFYARNLSFSNYSAKLNASAIKTCSGCEDVGNLVDNFEETLSPGGNTLRFSLVSFNNVTNKILLNQKIIDIVEDLDGSLLSNSQGSDPGGWIFSPVSHLKGLKSCNYSENLQLCYGRKDFQVKFVKFFDLRPENYYYPRDQLIVERLDNYWQSSEDFAIFGSREGTIDEDGALISHRVWNVPVVWGLDYRFWWKTGDWKQMTASFSRNSKELAGNTRLLFNFSDNFQSFQATFKENFTKTVNIQETSDFPAFFNGKTQEGVNFINSIKNKSLLVSVFGGINEKRVYFSRSFCDYKKQTCSNFNVTNKNDSSSNGTIDDKNNSNSSDNTNSTNNTNNNTDNANNTNNTDNNNTNNNDSTPIFLKWSEPDTWLSRRVPILNDDVRILPHMNVLLDVDPPELSNLYIEGCLKFPDDRPLSVLKSHNIYISTGKLIAGDVSSPFNNEIEIILTGDRTSPSINFASYIPSANKAIIVSGQLALYGRTPQTLWTRLMNSLSPKDVELRVEACEDWSSGDEILIASNSYENNTSERRVIREIVGDCLIKLNEPVEFSHEGAAFPQEFADVRTRVAVLTRNIRIKGQGSEDWGSRIVVFKDQSSKSRNSVENSVVLVGVSLENAGQTLSNFGGLGFEYAISSKNGHKVAGCAFVGSNSQCLKVLSSRNIEITGNLLVNCADSAILLENLNNDIKIQGNFVSTVYSSSAEILKTEEKLLGNTLVSGVFLKKSSYFPNNIRITDNIITNSEGYGAVLPGNDCETQNISLENNVFAGNYIGVFIGKNSSSCLLITSTSFIRNYYGLMAYPSETSQIIATNLRFLENYKSLLINMAVSNEALATSLLIMNSIFISSTEHSAFAISLPVATLLGKPLPIIDFNDLPIEKPLSSSRLLQKFTIYNCSFWNYQGKNSDNSFVFGNNPFVSDRFTTIQLNNVFFYNVSQGNLIEIGENAQLLCGNRSCTPTKTLLLKDLDGSFSGKKGNISPLNKAFPCQNQENVRIFGQTYGFCEENFAVLTVESLNQTENKAKSFSPLVIRETSTNESFEITCYKEFSEKNSPFFQGNTGCFNRFSTTLQSRLQYQLHFPQATPQSLRIFLESSPETSISLISLQFPSNVAARIKNSTGFLVQPVPFSQEINVSLLDSCGKHYIFPNGSVLLALSGPESCVVYSEVLDSVSISIGFDMTLEEFYQNDGFSLFIDKIASLLGIDTSKLRIAGVRTGSVYVDFYLDDEEGERLAGELVSQTKENKLDFLGKTVLSVEYTVFSAENLERNDSSPANKTHFEIHSKGNQGKHGSDGNIVALAVGLGVGLLALVGGLGILVGVCWRKRRNQKVEQESRVDSVSDLIEKRKKGEFIFDMKSFQTKNTDLELETIDN